MRIGQSTASFVLRLIPHKPRDTVALLQSPGELRSAVGILTIDQVKPMVASKFEAMCNPNAMK
jgi:hypothetical protein